MKNARTAVFGWLFLFVLAIIVCALILVSLAGCDSQNVNDLFQPGDYTVTFVQNNGEADLVWRKGDQVPSPTKKDCEFLYWCSDAELTVRADIDFDNFNLENNITLYAKWKEFDDIVGVKFDDVECVYDGNAHKIEVDESTLPEGTFVVYDKQTSYVDAGEYVVTATVKGDGYKDLVISKTLKIKKATLEGITFPGVSVVWDGQLHGAFVLYDKGELPSEVRVSYEGNGKSEVGIYDITAKFDTGANYEPIADMQTTLTITEKYFSVTFDDGISQPVVRSVAHGCSLEDIPQPTPKTGYDVVWNVTEFENVMADIDVGATYTPTAYTVSFVSAGETVKTEQYDIESALEFTDASRQHYIFEGWYASENFSGNRQTSIAVGNYGDKTYYAKWRAVEYFVTYHTNGGLNDVNNANCDGKYKFTVESDALTLKAPTRNFYVFEGWYTTENFEGDRVAACEKGTGGNIDLYAKWTAQTFEVSYDLAGGVNNPNNPLFTTIESGEFELLAPTKEDFDFVHWVDQTGMPVERIKANNTECVSLTAIWSEKTYSVEYETNGGVATVNKTSYKASDSNIPLGESQKLGYVFDGWFENADLSGEKVEEIDCTQRRNIKLYAAWKIQVYTIVYDLAGGENNDNPESYTIVTDDIVLSAPTRDGYAFDGWFDGERKVERIAKGSIGDRFFTARWSVEKFTITFDSKGGESVKPYIYTVESEDYTLPTISKEHYIFVGWFDENDNKVEKIVSSAKASFTLEAKWNAIEYKITYDYDGGEEVDNPTKYTIESDTFTLAESVKDGYTFEGWFDGDAKVTQIEKGSFGDITLKARWKEDAVVLPSDFVVENGILTAYIGNDTSITVHAIEAGENVVSIAKSAFDGVRESVTEIVIEEGVQSVEKGAFDGMSALVTLRLPSTVKTMHKGMLADCASLTNLSVPFASFVVASITDVSEDATIYEQNITSGAVVGFTYLFGEPQDTSNYAKVSGYGKDLSGNASVTICDAVTAYLPNALQNVVVLGGDIMDKCFSDVSMIKSLTYGGDFVGIKAFANCGGLEEIRFLGENVNFGAVAFANCSNMTICVANEAQKEIVDGLISSLVNVKCVVASN